MKREISFLIKIPILLLLAISATSLKAQTIFGSDHKWTGKESKEEIWRKMIDIDMSVPDFNTTKVDQRVMGWRLAKMIDFIQKSYNQGSYNRTLSIIRYELTEDPTIRFAGIDKLEFLRAEKRDSLILMKWHSYTKLENKEKVNHDFTMRLINGVSDNEAVNNYFSDISRYIKPDEDD